MTISPGLALTLGGALIGLILLAASRGPRRLRWRLMLVSAALVAANVALLALRFHEVEPRVIFVVDDVSAFESSEYAELVATYGRAGMSTCDTAAVADLGGSGAPLEWRRGDGCLEHPQVPSLVAKRPVEAIEKAIARHAGRGAWMRARDWFWGVSSRVVVLVTSSSQWEKKRWHFDPAPTAANARRADVEVDAIYAEMRSTESPVMTIEVDPKVLPLHHRSTRLNITVRSSLLGSRMPTSVTLRCFLDKGSIAPFELPAGFPLRDSVEKDRWQSGWIDLRVFRYGSSEPDPGPGFHLLECEVDLRTEDGRAVLAQAARYVEVSTKSYVIIQGNDASYRLDDGKEGVDAADLADAWERRRTLGSLFELSFAGVHAEDAVLAAVNATGNLFPDLPREPTMIVLHAVTRWAELCKALDPLVAGGSILVISGAPAEHGLSPMCSFLPTSAVSTQDGQAIFFDRRPRITFVEDHTRTGELIFRKHPGKEPDLPRSSEGTGPDYRSGARIQRRIIDGTCSALKQVDAKLDCARVNFSTAEEEKRRLIRVRTLQSLSKNSARDATHETELEAGSQIETRAVEPVVAPPETATKPLTTPEPVIRAGDVYIVFAYDAEQNSDSITRIVDLLSRGVLVYVVTLESPFGDALRSAKGEASLEERVRARLAKPAVPSPLQAGTDVAFGPEGLTKRLFVGGDSLTISLDSLEEDNTIKVIEFLTRELAARITPLSARMMHERSDRFVSDIWGERWTSGSSLKDAWAAPLRFQVLRAPGTGTETWTARYLVAVPEPTEAERNQKEGIPLALAYGAPYGRGSIIVHGYSLFEGGFDDLRSSLSGPLRDQEHAWITRMSGDRKRRFEKDRWGTQRIFDAIRYHSRLEPGPTANPRITRAAIVDGKGRLNLDVVQDLELRAAVDEVQLVRCTDESEKFAAACRPAGPRATGRPIHLDPSRQLVTYEFEPTELRRLCECKGGQRCTSKPRCGASLVRTAAGEQAVAALDPQRVWIDGSQVESEVVTENLRATDSLDLLASYTGGSTHAAKTLVLSQPFERSTRINFLVAVLVVLVGGWTTRVVRRVRDSGTVARLAQSEANRAVGIAPAGAVREAGDALGRPRAEARAGAFAMYRTIEPGDQLASAVLDDVIVYARQRQRRLKARPPRITTRIDERSRSVTIVVNVGLSMQIPADRDGVAPKLIEAALVGEVLAEVAFIHRCSVTIAAMGAGPVTYLGPFSGRPGDGEILRFLCGRGNGKRGAEEPALEPILADADGGVIYISDLHNENLERVAAVARNFEDEGGSFAAVRVWSAAEFRLLDTCWAPGQRVACERTDWTPEDLQAEHEALTRRCEGLFSEMTGGFLVVSGGTQAPELVLAIQSHRILELMR